MKSRAAWKLRELFPPPAWEENGEQRSRLFLDRNTRATLGDESGGDGWDRDGPQGIQPSCPSTAAGTFTQTHTPRTLQTPTSPQGPSRCSDPSAPSVLRPGLCPRRCRLHKLRIGLHAREREHPLPTRAAAHQHRWQNLNVMIRYFSQISILIELRACNYPTSLKTCRNPN